MPSVFQLGEAPTQQDAMVKKLSWNLLNPLTGTAVAPHLSLLSTPAPAEDSFHISTFSSELRGAAVSRLTLLWVCADEADEAAAPKASGCFMVGATWAGCRGCASCPNEPVLKHFRALNKARNKM